MKNFFFCFCAFIVLAACNNSDKGPDISGIQVSVVIQRFEQDLFTADTNNLQNQLTQLNQKYPGFLPVFLHGVLGLTDSNVMIQSELKKFLSLNRSVYTEVEKKYKSVEDIRSNFEKAFRYVKYYFPKYAVPKLITLVGPIDALAQMNNGEYTPDFLGRDFLGISLQFYLGKDYELYNVEYFINNVAPTYRSRRFEKEFIVADGMKLIVDDIYPDNSNGKPLIEQMIEKGKQWWLLDKFLPAVNDTLKTGYTKNQLEWCKENEGMIWNYFLTSENMEAIDPETVQLYVAEAPFTQGMPEASPGNIGPWVGWQIIKKFVERNPKLSVTDVLKTDARKILQDSKYKPK